MTRQYMTPVRFIERSVLHDNYMYGMISNFSYLSAFSLLTVWL